MHYIDKVSVKNDHLGLGRILLYSTHISVGGNEREGSIEKINLHKVGNGPVFSELSSTQKLLYKIKPDRFSGKTFVADIIVDVLLHYPSDNAIESYFVESNLNPILPKHKDTIIVLDYSLRDVKVFRSSGFMSCFILIENSPIQVTTNFLKEGVINILTGLDQVLFVRCITISSNTLNFILWYSTGFTIGHSITLEIGFPSDDWFVPLIETGMALFIIYSGRNSMKIELISFIEKPKTSNEYYFHSGISITTWARILVRLTRKNTWGLLC